jgi:hypothetical protein
VLIAVACAAGPAMAQSESQSGDPSAGPPAPRPKHKPIDLEIEAPSLDFTQDIAKFLNDFHDEYRAYKKEIRRDYDVQYSLLVSIFPQWGTPNGGPGVVQLAYEPNILWSPFKNTAVGSGSFSFSMLQTQYWTKATTESQQAQLGLITPPNNQVMNLRQYNQLMYTHTFPNTWNWLSVTVGQYTFAAFDSNLYAGNALTNFISYPLTQNGTQAYPNGGLGAYAQATSRDQQFAFAGGFQGATNVTGDALSTRGFSDGKYTYFMAGEWAPNFLGGGAYSLLGCSQPSVSQQPGNSLGVSFNAVQNIDSKWGLFLRANSASGETDRDLGRMGWNLQQSVRPQPPRPSRARHLLGQDQPEGSGPACAECGMGSRTLSQLRPLQGLVVHARYSTLLRPGPAPGRWPRCGLHDPHHGSLLTQRRRMNCDPTYMNLTLEIPRRI